MRQIAIISIWLKWELMFQQIMAIAIFDQIFTRIGADDLVLVRVHLWLKC